MSNVPMMRDLYDALSRYTGTFKQTGKKLGAHACHVWKIRDGKVTSFQRYADIGQLQDVEGVR